MRDLDGKAFTDKSTLKDVACAALMAQIEGDQAITVDQKLKQFTLLQAVHKGGVVDISAEDITLLKTRAAKCLAIVAVGRLCEMLEKEYVAPPDLKSVS